MSRDARQLMESDYVKTTDSLDTKSVLKHLDVELTERCNNDCVHCYIRRGSGAADAGCRMQDAGGKEHCEMSTDEITGVLEEAAGLGCLTVRFTGGEPLLGRDFADIYVAARKLGLKVVISTNATLITPDLADLFARMPPLEDIDVTLYGATVETYEAVSRTPGSYEAALKGLRLLQERNIPYATRSVYLPKNKADMESVAPWRDVDCGLDTPPDCTVHLDLRARRDSDELNARIIALRAPPAEVIRELAKDRSHYLADMKRFCAGFTRPPGDLLFRCAAGGRQAAVDAYGGVQMCLLLRHPDTVLAKEQGAKCQVSGGRLRYALTEFFPEVRKRKATNPDYLARCAKCFLNGLCEQCPAKSWTEHGTLDTPLEYYCEITHLQALDLGLLKPGEKTWQVTDWQSRLNTFCS